MKLAKCVANQIKATRCLILNPERSFAALVTSAICLATLCSGCVTHTAILPGSLYPTDYAIGALYRTRQDLVFERNWGGGDETFFVPPPDSYPRLSDVQARPKHFAKDYRILEAGTLVRIERFDLEKNPESGRTMWIRSRVLTGPIANRGLYLTFISREAGNSPLGVRLLLTDTNFLECIKDQ